MLKNLLLLRNLFFTAQDFFLLPKSYCSFNYFSTAHLIIPTAQIIISQFITSICADLLRWNFFFKDRWNIFLNCFIQLPLGQSFIVFKKEHKRLTSIVIVSYSLNRSNSIVKRYINLYNFLPDKVLNVLFVKILRKAIVDRTWFEHKIN